LRQGDENVCREPTEPQVGDSEVRLRIETCHGDRLDERVLAMSAAFVAAMRGNKLRRVQEFEPRSGSVRFVTRGPYVADGERRSFLDVNEWKGAR
jgi:hypothetical protein